MKFQMSARTKRDQRGFTLIEVLVAVLITGIIGAAVCEAIYQVFSVSARNTNSMTALKQVEYAVRWITPDAQMAQTVSGNLTGTDGLTLAWTEYDGTSENVTYKIENSELKRSYTRDGVLQSTKVVSTCIDSANTSSSYADGTIVFTITSAVNGYRSESITRTFNVTLRSSTV